MRSVISAISRDAPTKLVPLLLKTSVGSPLLAMNHCNAEVKVSVAKSQRVSMRTALVERHTNRQA